MLQSPSLSIKGVELKDRLLHYLASPPLIYPYLSRFWINLFPMLKGAYASVRLGAALSIICSCWQLGVVKTPETLVLDQWEV